MWIWEKRLLAGRINLVAGMGDVGKDVLCCDAVARKSTGRDWPDGAPCAPGLVGYVSSEDGIGDTLIPRLTAAGADLSRVRIWNRDEPPQPDDLDGLQLVVISPLVQILPDGRLAQYDQGIRKMIGPWKAKCEASGCTIIGTVHYNKKNDLAAVQRILGSVGLPNALRNTWCIERDDDDATLRLFMRVKANLTPDSVDGLAYRIVHVGPWSQSIRCDWQPEPVAKTADVCGRRPKPRSSRPASGCWRTCASTATWRRSRSSSKPPPKPATATKQSSKQNTATRRFRPVAPASATTGGGSLPTPTMTADPPRVTRKGLLSLGCHSRSDIWSIVIERDKNPLKDYGNI
jgi:AAA domain